MKWQPSLLALVCTLAASAAFALPAGISGGYLETRSCDVYTGPCFANGEMGLTGKEAILVWSVDQGAWDGISLDGLSVIAVVRTAETLGDVRYAPREGRAMLVLDEKASPEQREALQGFALEMGGALLKDIVAVETAPIEAKLGTCDGSGCASVQAGEMITINTRCMGGKDHVCGNERAFYPPLTKVQDAYPVYTTLASFQGCDELNLKFEAVEQRGTYLARFSR